jgi:hypothetical protein
MCLVINAIDVSTWSEVRAATRSAEVNPIVVNKPSEMPLGARQTLPQYCWGDAEGPRRHAAH